MSSAYSCKSPLAQRASPSLATFFSSPLALCAASPIDRTLSVRMRINALYWIPNAMGGTQTYFLRLVEARLAADDGSLCCLPKCGGSETVLVARCPPQGRGQPSVRTKSHSANGVGECRDRPCCALDATRTGALVGVSFTFASSSASSRHRPRHDSLPSSAGNRAVKLLFWKRLMPVTLRRADSIISSPKLLSRTSRAASHRHARR